MTDEKTPAPAPAAAPTQSQPAPEAPKAAPQPAAQQSKPIARTSAGVITNPTPPVDTEAPPVEKVPQGLPQSTIDEMAAGKKALERNQPVAKALEDNRAAKDAGTITTPETNPVDATQTLRQQGKV